MPSCGQDGGGLCCDGFVGVLRRSWFLNRIVVSVWSLGVLSAGPGCRKLGCWTRAHTSFKMKMSLQLSRFNQNWDDHLPETQLLLSPSSVQSALLGPCAHSVCACAGVLHTCGRKHRCRGPRVCRSPPGKRRRPRSWVGMLW